jgi:hypothetical protein
MCPTLSVESILALSNGYFGQCSSDAQDLESASLLFNEGQALLELLIPQCSPQEGHFEYWVSLHSKYSFCLRNLLHAQNVRSLDVIRDLL